MRKFAWTTLRATPELPENEVQVWRVYLDVLTPAFDLFLELLCAEEKGRAHRFRNDRDRRRYIVARGLLRMLLAGYLARDPRKLLLRYTSKGKPFLEEPSLDIRFNVSHSKGLALFAFTVGREVGVDLEEIRRIPGWDNIAFLFFSENEVRTLLTLEPASQTEAFFLCWTRKEAYLKAKGEGVSQGLGYFDVSLVPGEPARLMTSRDDPGEVRRWRLESLSPEDGFAGAVAAEGQDWLLRLCQFELPAWTEGRI